MAHRRGRTAAIITGIAALAVIAAAITCRERLLEEWYLRRLASSDEETHLGAAERLAEMKSLRAVPRFIAIIREDGREGSALKPDSRIIYLTPIAFALYRIGQDGLPGVEEAIRAAGDPTGDTKGRFSGVLTVIRDRWEKPRPVERISYREKPDGR